MPLKAIRPLAVAALVVVCATSTLEGQLPSQPAATNGLILGRVVDAATNRPISRATVQLGGVTPQLGSTGLPAPPPTVLSNAEGYFLFRGIARGTYPITVNIAGYLPGAYGRALPEGPSRPVRLADDQRVTDVTIRLWRYAAISGRVLDESGEPAVGVQVRAMKRIGNKLIYAPPTNSFSAQTDDRGMYRLASLVPGDYLVCAPATMTTMPAELTGQSTIASMELRRNLPLTVSIGTGILSGEGVRVGDLSLFGDVGRPGPEPGADGRIFGYQTVFHPATTNPGVATVVSLGSGAERTDIDLQLKLSPMLRVSGTVTTADGTLQGIGVRLVPMFAEHVAVEGSFDAAQTLTNTTGRFTFLGVPPGQYFIKATRQPPPPRAEPSAATNSTTISMNMGGTSVMMVSSVGAPGGGFQAASSEPTLGAVVPVTVADTDLTGVAVMMRPGARLSGRVVFEGSAGPPPQEAPRFGVQVIPTVEGSIGAQPVPIGGDGAFTTAQFPEGRYVVAPTMLPNGWFVRSVTAGGRNALAHPLTLAGEDVNDVLITMTRQSSDLSGTVRRAAATGDPNAIVVLVPADYQSWIDEGMLARYARSASVQADGTYEITNVIPGEYLVAAVAADIIVDTRNPSAIPALSRVATRISIAEGDKKSQPLTVSQPR